MSIAKVPVFGAQPFGFKATDVSGCKLWLDASDLQTVYQMIPYGDNTGIETLTDSQRFLFWKDKSTGNYDMIRKVAPNDSYDPGQPISYENPPYNLLNNSPEFYGPSIQPANGYAGEVHPKVTFVQYSGAMEGSNVLNTYPEYLSQNLVSLGGYNGDVGGNPGPSGPRLGGDPVYNTEVFVVVKPRYLSTPGNVFSIGSKPGATADFTSLAITSSGYWKINSQGGTRDVTSSSPEQLNLYSNDTNFRLLNMSLSNTNYVLRRNSIQIAQAHKSWSPTLSDYQYLLAKRSIGDGADPFDGSIGEVIVFDNIIDNEKRTIVESYLAYKWNLIPLLPENHPARWRDRPIQIGGLSLADAPNEYTRRGTIIKIRSPPPPILNTPTISIGAINIDWTSTANIFDIIIQQSPDFVSFTNYLTFANQFLVTPIFSYNLTTGSEYGKYYKFSIRAKSGPAASTYATSAYVGVPFLPGVPVSLDVDSAPNTFQSSWLADGPGEGIGVPTSYSLEIYRETEPGSFTLETTIPVVSTSYDYPITLTGTYKFKVAALNEIGQSAYSGFSSDKYIEYVPGT